MYREVAQRALERRSIAGPVVGVGLQAGVLGAVGLGVTRGLGLDLPIWGLGAAGLALAGGLEVGVQRARAARMAEVRPLLEAVIGAVGEAGEPRVTWARGLPRLEVHDTHPYAIHFEPAGPRLRVAVTVAFEPAATAWLVSRQAEDFPHRLVRRLGSRLTRLAADDATLCALSAEPADAEVMLARPGVLDALRALLAADAPRAATLEIGPADARWDVAIHPGVTANRLISLAKTLPELLGRGPTADGA